MSTDAQTAILAKPGKYLSCVLGRHDYGLEILKVQEIVGVMDVARVPRTPPHVRGVIHRRGRVIPVVDLRSMFGGPAAEDTEKTCVIVVQIARDDPKVTMGLIVDEVSEVLSFTREQIEPARGFDGLPDEVESITGVGKLGEKVVILLDPDRVLKRNELAQIAWAARTPG